MSTGLHFMALDLSKERLTAIEAEYASTSLALAEAIKLRDLSENSEYSALKPLADKLAQEREELAQVITMPTVRSSDNVPIIEEGSIIELIVYNVTQTPIPPGTAAFEELKTSGIVNFRGTLMYGATLSMHELLADNALSSATAVGKFINGKQSGDYSVTVPGGFANITVTKLSSDTPRSELNCEV